MPQICENLSLYGELNLFLVSNRIKPVAFICLEPFEYDTVGYHSEPNTHFLKLEDKEIIKFKKLLRDLNVLYVPSNKRLFVKKGRYGSLNYEDMVFTIARDEHSLQKLLDAKNEREIGLAFGFPEDAVNSYQQVIDGELRDGGYFWVCLAKCKQAGLEIPTWLAYLDAHVPRDIDLAAGKVSESSWKLGMKYQEFTRKHNLSLAERVEYHFLQKNLPIEWQLKPDCRYSIEW